jgi:hypothetical protein
VKASLVFMFIYCTGRRLFVILSTPLVFLFIR